MEAGFKFSPMNGDTATLSKVSLMYLFTQAKGKLEKEKVYLNYKETDVSWVPVPLAPNSGHEFQCLLE